ncbi:helix-turn-helix domain-containing protein [Methylobacterium sp. E-041]|uniref:helix-turn-helix domain-containing protein n=1 Tax=unclassified Methylobacterium TaxID=2615210 RepID=UPI001FB9284A|nr:MULTISPECIES: helix-turn-helix domain-containing protein [unclassified Methylobacterium]MCJ2037610.1 helix-turn-helix domain-containing protein [Methylobacterium sp. J-059]MCJ2105360.1 helix-turn-helix domain-containing protein [Methylobacterium sp. E-041]
MSTQSIQTLQEDLRAPDGKLLHRINDTCDMLGVGRTTLYRLIAEGKLVTVKVYGSSRVTDESIRAFMTSLMIEAA